MKSEDNIFECKNNHHGRNLRRIRRASDIKQDALAAAMGLSQAQISAYEQKRVISDGMIQQFAKALNVAPELIKELEESPLTIIIENNPFSSNIGYMNGDHIINNPIEQILELNKEKTILYERMLELEKEKNVLLERFLREEK